MVKINGESLEIAGRTIAQYIATTSYDIRRIAIECNGEIVPKAVYETKNIAGWRHCGSSQFCGRWLI